MFTTTAEGRGESDRIPNVRWGKRRCEIHAVRSSDSNQILKKQEALNSQEQVKGRGSQWLWLLAGARWPRLTSPSAPCRGPGAVAP